MSMTRLKWLMVIVGIELVGVVSLLLWVVFTPSSEQTATTFTAQTLAPAKVQPVLIAKGLGVPTAITATGESTDTRIFVAERHGLIHIVDQNKVSATPFLDISSKVKDEGEMGLLGLAFHPKFQNNGYFFVNYVDPGQNTVIARYQIDKTTGLANPASGKVLLTLKQPYPNHNGGQLAFGPDGYLYIGLGDGGSAGDPENRAQNLGVLFGKILRIDVDHGDPYAIPQNNPFVAQAGAKPEIWAYGLRNPWRFSFDSKTGDLYIADVGQDLYEEIDYQNAGSTGGSNYGWRCYEAAHPYNTAGCQAADHYTAPILEYPHTDKRCSIVGGAVYRGSAYPTLYGKYFYSDTCGGQLYMAAKMGGQWASSLALATTFGPTTFGVDNRGELYLSDMKDGSLYHLTDAANTPTN